MAEKEKITFNPNKLRTSTRINKGRQTMKVQIKFSAEDSAAYKNFLTAFKPPEMGDDDFHKVVFLRGVQGIHMDATDKLEAYLKEHPEKLEELKKIAAEEKEAAGIIEVPQIDVPVESD